MQYEGFLTILIKQSLAFRRIIFHNKDSDIIVKKRVRSRSISLIAVRHMKE